MNSENWVVSTIYQKLLIIFNYLFYKSVLTLKSATIIQYTIKGRFMSR